MVMQILRTATPNHPPPALEPGQLAVEMASNPPRLWVGVPTSIDPTGRKQITGGGKAWRTGDVRLTYKTVAPPNWIMCNDGSLGNASSGATARANADALDLFKLLYDWAGDGTVLLIGNGSAGFTDQSGSGHVVNPGTAYLSAPAGNLGTLDTAINFPANTQLWLANSTDWRFGTGPFCIEMYVRPASFTLPWQLLLAENWGGAFRLSTGNAANANRFVAEFAGWGAGWVFGSPWGEASLNDWNHVATYRLGNNFYGAHNGVVTFIGTTTGALGATTGQIVMGLMTGFNNFVGQMAGIRITKGASRYGAANFTPPPPPLSIVKPRGVTLDLQDSAGAAVARGANAVDDFTANRRLVLPRMLGRALAVAGQGAGLSVQSLGDWNGAETVALNVAQLPNHAHILPPGPVYQYAESYVGTWPANAWGVNSSTGWAAGGGASHANNQPTTWLNAIIRL